jgi:putative peptidoglycan lipid II flippase
MGDVARFDSRFRKRLPRILLASAIMGGALWVAMLALGPWLATAYIRYLALFALILVGAIAFFLSARLAGALSLTELKAGLRRSA